jgi:hypothetical protein
MIRFTGAVITGSVAAGALGMSGAFAAESSDATTEQQIIASSDAYTSSTRTTYNTGASDKLVVGTTGGETKVSYMIVRVPELAAGDTVRNAKLKLVTDGQDIPGTLTVSKVAKTTWSEKTITAENAPTIGATVAQVTAPAGATSVNIDLTGAIDGAGAYSFAITSSLTDDVVRFRSGEYTVRAERPTLTLTTGPVAQECKVDAKLVPSCGVLWGAAAGGFSDTPRDQAIQDWEKASGRTATIWHQYHKGDELFPTKAEIAMTKDAANPRTLLVNWKVAEGTTWAKVAAGEKNARIDRLAAYLKANFNDTPFFLAPHHEPENDVIATAGSGMTAKDYAKMYRHVVTRLKAQGVTNAINVVAYMGNEKWMAQSWWNDLYPGDDVVDWIGLDSYVNAQPGGYHYGDFADLLDRAPTGGGLGFYDWATTKHASKPLMIAEWGVYHSTTKPADKAAIFDTVLPELKKRPGIKAMVYFDAVKDDEGDRNLTIESSPDTLASFQKIAADPIFDVKLR